jgi:acetyl-CoA acetyltransferase
MHNPGGRYNVFGQDRVSGLRQFTAPYGLMRGFQFFGGVYRKYMCRYGATRRHMGALIVNNRNNASLNPRAYFRDSPLTIEEYMEARMIAEPMSILDCDIPVDGAVALVLTTAERARDLPHRPAYVAGFSQYVGNPGDVRSRELRLGPPLEDHQRACRDMMSVLWSASGLDVSDVDVAQLYDGYSCFMYFWLEAAGFCGEGEAFEFVQDGRIALGGDLPLNTFGGQLGEGRLHGIGHLFEAAAQIMGRADARQVPGAEVSIAVIGPGNDGSAAVAFTSQPV